MSKENDYDGSWLKAEIINPLFLLKEEENRAIKGTSGGWFFLLQQSKLNLYWLYLKKIVNTSHS